MTIPGEGDHGDKRLLALSETMRAFAEATTDYGRLLDVIAEHMARLVGDGCLLVLVSDDEQWLLPGSVYFHDAAAMGIARRLLGAKPVRVGGTSLGSRIARTRTGILVPRVDCAELASQIAPEYAAVLQDLPVRSLLSFPLEIHGRVLGIVSLVRLASASGAFTEQDDAVARNLSAHAALALHNARLLKSLQFELEERARAEAEAQRFVALVQHSSDFIAMAGLDGRVLFVNDAGRNLLGIGLDEDVTEMKLTDFHTAEGMKRAEIIRAEGRWQGEGKLRHSKTGELIDTQVSSFLVRGTNGQPFGFATVQRDIRETKKIEAHLRQVQRMEAVGRLAGGVAHDFNNILSVILGYSALLLGDLSIDAPSREDVEEIHVAAQRAAGLTKQLLAFSRQQVLEPRVVDLNEVVANTEKMVTRLLGEDIRLRTNLGEGLGKVKVDVGQMEQVLVNLAVNARDAMPHGGVLTIATANEGPCDDPDESPDRAHNPCVALTVSDTGVGMDEATQQRIFEPFFTTKEKGRGTGLGLSTVLGIVEQSGGSVAVRSAPGRGSTFQIRLPRCDEAAPSVPPSGMVSLSASRGVETILLVEDEAQLRKLMRGVLARAGYRVLDCGDPEAALRESAAWQGEIHLLLTDVIMPRMNGRQLAEHVVARRPDIRVLYVSGYTEDAIGFRGAIGQDLLLLRKPVTPELLLKRVREALEQSMPPARPAIL